MTTEAPGLTQGDSELPLDLPEAPTLSTIALSVEAPRSTPLTPNPFRALREKKGLTLHTVAVRAEVSRYLIIRTEQGCFPMPPPKLLRYFVEELGVSETDCVKDYHQFQKATREDNGKFLGPLPGLNELYPTQYPDSEPLPGAPHEVAVHPFAYWRSIANKNDFNLTEVSKMLCVAQPVLYHFENRPRQQGSVPQQLRFALEDAGYDKATLDGLKFVYDKYREFLRTKAA